MSATKRIALMVPSSNTVIENDLHHALPKGSFTVHTARMALVETTQAAELEMVERDAPRAARLLATAKPDLLVFGCTSAGALFGSDGDRALADRLGAIAGCPGIGVMTSAIEALKRREVRRVALLTPYIEPLTLAIAASLEQTGFEVVASHSLGIDDNVALADPTPEEIAEIAVDRFAGVACDVVFISCTNFRALEAVPAVAAALSRPVVTSNLAVIEAIKSCGWALTTTRAVA
jgi:maleate isomerase